MKLFAIDPGTQKLGWAMFNERSLEESGLIEDTGEPFERCSAIARAVYYQVSFLQPDKVICEYPHKGGPGIYEPCRPWVDWCGRRCFGCGMRGRAAPVPGRPGCGAGCAGCSPPRVPAPGSGNAARFSKASRHV